MPAESRLTVGKVFVVGGLPTVTYNPRTQLGLEQLVEDYLDDRHKILSISGPTKTGKTVLVRRVLKDSPAIWVSGGQVPTAGALWATVADELDLDTTVESSRQDTDGESRTVTGELSVLGAVKGGRSGQETVATSLTDRRARTRPVEIAARKALRQSQRPLVIDDFHYIDPDTQLSIVRSLKDLVFEGVPVIVIAVPHRAYDVVRVEKEMTGRVQQLPIEFWSNDDLLRIAEKGFEALNVVDERGRIAQRLAAESFASPHLMQDFCRHALVAAGIRGRTELPVPLAEPVWSGFFRERANAASKAAFELLARGPRQRTGRKPRRLRNGMTVDIYGSILMALGSTGPLTCIAYEQVRESLGQILADAPPKGQEVIRVLKEMSRIARDQVGGEPVVDYDADLRTLYISDPYFAFFLRWQAEAELAGDRVAVAGGAEPVPLPGAPPPGERAEQRVFVSYAGRDRAWAEWVAYQLHTAGYAVELDVWDWGPGDEVVVRMGEALARSDLVVALFSPAYLERERFTTDEWTTTLPVGHGRGRLVSLRVEEVSPPEVLRAVPYRDLFGMPEDHVRRVLLEAVGGGRRPIEPPRGGPRLPGLLPDVWNVPRRAPTFTGRDAALVRLREQLASAGIAVVRSADGAAGVGISQLAIEYAHRFAGDYELVWWIDAGRPELIGSQLARLGDQAGWSSLDTSTATALAAVKQRLRASARWLLVFDDAAAIESLRPFLPDGPGHVLITSRAWAWDPGVVRLQVGPFARAESVALLRRLAPSLAEPEADRLADLVGDLPLTVAQVAGLLAETGMPVERFREFLANRTQTLLAAGSGAAYPASLEAAVELSIGLVWHDQPDAGQVLEICALLATGTVPLDIFATAPPGVLDEPLATLASSPLVLRRGLELVQRYGLATVDDDGVRLHALIQALIRDRLSADGLRQVRREAAGLVAAVYPADPADPTQWPRCTQLLPHLLALNPESTDDHDLRRATLRAAWYLLASGEIAVARELAARCHADWSTRLGPEDEDTLAAASALAQALRRLGEHAQALELYQEIHQRRRRIRGDDDPATLSAASNLASTLTLVGRTDEAFSLEADILDRRRDVLGPDHPTTLSTANNLAVTLRRMGRLRDSEDLATDTLARYRKVLGPDHPNTLDSARNLAIVLRDGGRYEESRRLDEDTLDRYRSLLGGFHPETLRTAMSLAVTLSLIGLLQQARRLADDTLDRARRALGDDHAVTRLIEGLSDGLSDS